MIYPTLPTIDLFLNLNLEVADEVVRRWANVVRQYENNEKQILLLIEFVNELQGRSEDIAFNLYPHYLKRLKAIPIVPDLSAPTDHLQKYKSEGMLLALILRHALLNYIPISTIQKMVDEIRSNKTLKEYVDAAERDNDRSFLEYCLACKVFLVYQEKLGINRILKTSSTIAFGLLQDNSAFYRSGGKDRLTDRTDRRNKAFQILTDIFPKSRKAKRRMIDLTDDDDHEQKNKKRRRTRELNSPPPSLTAITLSLSNVTIENESTPAYAEPRTSFVGAVPAPAALPVYPSPEHHRPSSSAWGSLAADTLSFKSYTPDDDLLETRTVTQELLLDDVQATTTPQDPPQPQAPGDAIHQLPTPAPPRNEEDDDDDDQEADDDDDMTVPGDFDGAEDNHNDSKEENEEEEDSSMPEHDKSSSPFSSSIDNNNDNNFTMSFSHEAHPPFLHCFRWTP